MICKFNFHRILEENADRNMMVLFDLSLTIWYNANCDKIVSKANIIKRIIFSEDSASAQNGQIREGLNETKLGIEKIR